MRPAQERIEQAELVHDAQRRRMDRVAAEVAQEVGVLLEHDRAHSGASEQVAEHHSRRTAAGDAALRRRADRGGPAVGVEGRCHGRSLGSLVAHEPRKRPRNASTRLPVRLGAGRVRVRAQRRRAVRRLHLGAELPLVARLHRLEDRRRARDLFGARRLVDPDRNAHLRGGAANGLLAGQVFAGREGDDRADVARMRGSENERERRRVARAPDDDRRAPGIGLGPGERGGEIGQRLVVARGAAERGGGAVAAAERAVARALVDRQHREAGLDQARRDRRVLGAARLGLVEGDDQRRLRSGGTPDLAVHRDAVGGTQDHRLAARGMGALAATRASDAARTKAIRVMATRWKRRDRD